MKNQAKFQQNEQLVLESVLDAIPAGVNIIDRHFVIQKVNHWIEDHFVEKQPLVGKNCFQVTHNCLNPHENCPSMRALKSGKIESSTLQMSLKGEIKWVNITSFPLKDKKNHIYGFIEYIIDVTEKKKEDQLQQVILDISNAVHNTIDTVDLLHKIREILSSVIDTSNFFVALYNKESDTLELPFFVDEHDDFVSFPAGKTLTERVIRTGTPLLLREEEMADMAKAGLVEQFGSSSKVWLGVPLTVQEEIVGVLTVQSYTDKETFGERELDILKFVSEQIAIAIERKQTEKNLQHEQALMQALLENTTDFIYFKDRQGRFTKTNRVHAHYLGIDEPHQLIGKTDFDFYPRELAEKFHQEEQEIIRSGIPVINKEEKAPLAKVKDEWFLTTKIPIRNEKNDLIGTCGVTRNITMLKQTENELRQSEIQYRTTLNSMLDGIHVVDEKLCVILANNSLFELNKSLGFTCDIYGLKVTEVYPFLSADVVKQYEHVFSTGEIVNTHEENKIGDKLIYTETRKIPIFENGRVAQVLTVIHNVTDRHQRERELARLAAAVEQTGDFIIILDKDGKIEYVNPAYEEITGLAKDELLGQSAAILKNNLQNSEFYHTIWQTISTGSAWSGHLVNLRKDGTKYEEDVSIFPIYDEFGALQSFISVGRDVTREINMRKQLTQSQKMEAIGTLAGGIAHDFNNILASIIGFSQLSMMQTPAGSKLERNMQNILKACDRARELTLQILLYSRGDDQEKQPLQIELVVREAIKLLKASLPSTILLTQDIQKECGYILGNVTQIHQILMNLATNAAHAMPDRKGHIGISLQEKRVLEKNSELLKPGMYVQLSVSDTGCGIPEEIQERVFDPFFTTKPSNIGTGLGLSVVHGIVKSLNGHIHLQSQPGKGATFTILLPQIDAAQKVQMPPHEQTLPNGTETILFIDDEPDLIQIGEEILKKLGYNVVATTSSQKGLALFKKNPHQFNLIITDQTMPEMTGETLASLIREIDAGIPILLCTGFSEILTDKDRASISINRIISKPFYIDELSRAIRELLDAR